MSMAQSIFSNESLHDVQVKRTRSGRVVIPPLAGWSGERIFSSLDDGVPPTYVGPSLDKRAHYLLPSSMLERLQNQKLLQDPLQVEEKSFSAGSSSKECDTKCGSSESSIPDQKQKSMGTRLSRKPGTRRKNKLDVSQSEPKLTYVEIHQTSQRKKMKNITRCLASDESDRSDNDKGMKKSSSCLPMVYGESDSSDVDNRKKFSETDSLAAGLCTVLFNHSLDKGFSEKQNGVYQDSSCHTTSQESNIAKSQNIVDKAVLTNLDPNQVLPPNVHHVVKDVQHINTSSEGCAPHSSSCEVGDEGEHQNKIKCVADQTQPHENSESYQAIPKISGTYQKQKHMKKYTKSKQNCNSNKEQQQKRYNSNKGSKKHGRSSLNIGHVAICESYLNNDISGGSEKTACDNYKTEFKKSTTVISPGKRACHIRINRDEPDKKRVELQQSSYLSGQHSFDIDRLSEDDRDTSLKTIRSRKNAPGVSKKQTAEDGVFLKRTTNGNVVVREDQSLNKDACKLKTHKLEKHRETVEFNHEESMHSAASNSLYEIDISKHQYNKGQIAHEVGLKRDTHVHNKSEDHNCTSYRDLSEGKYVTDQLKVKKTVHSDFLNDVCALNEVSRKQSDQKETSEVRTTSFNQNINLHNKHDFVEIDILSEGEMSYSTLKIQPSVMAPSVKRDLSKNLEDCCCSNSSVSSTKAELKSISKKDKSHPLECNHSQHCKQKAVYGKHSRCDRKKNLLHGGSSDFSELLYNDDSVVSDLGSDSDCTQSREDFEQKKILISKNFVDDEILTNNLCKDRNFTDSCINKPNCATIMNSCCQNPVRIDTKLGKKQFSEIQNDHTRNGKNHNKKKSTESSFPCFLNQSSSKPHLLKQPLNIGSVASPNPQICSPGQDLCLIGERKNPARLSESRSVIKLDSSKNDAKSPNSQNDISHHGPRMKTSKSFKRSSMKRQQQSTFDVASSDFANSSSNNHTVLFGKKCLRERKNMGQINYSSFSDKTSSSEQKNIMHSHRETHENFMCQKKNPNPNQNILLSDEYHGYPNENANNTERNSKKHKLKVASNKGVLLKEEPIRRDLIYKKRFSRHRTDGSDRECLQSRRDAKSGPISAALTDNCILDDTSHLNATFTLPCRADYEVSNQCNKNQDTNQDIIENDLDHTASENSTGYAKNGAKRQKASTTCSTMHTQDHNIFEVDSSTQESSGFSGVVKRWLLGNEESYSCNKGIMLSIENENTSTASNCNNGSAKGHDYGYHFNPKSKKQKSHKSDSVINSHSLPYKVCSNFVGNGHNVCSEASNLDNEYLQTKGNFSKNIPLSKSSVDCDLLISQPHLSVNSMCIAAENNSKSVMNKNCSSHFKMKSEKGKNFKCGSVTKGSVHANSVDVVHCNNLLLDSTDSVSEHARTGKHCASNIPNFKNMVHDSSCSSLCQNLMNNSQEENEYRDINQAENNGKQNKNAGEKKSKSLFACDDASKSINGYAACSVNIALRENSLKLNSKTEKNVHCNSQNHLSHTRCPNISFSRKRRVCSHNVKNCMCTKDNASAVIHGNTSITGINSDEYSNMSNHNCYHKQKLEKVKGSEHSSVKNRQSVPSDNCFNSGDLISHSRNISLSDSSYSDDDHASRKRKRVSSYSVDDGTSSSNSHQNHIFTQSCEENHIRQHCENHNGSSSVMNDHRFYYNAEKDKNGNTVNNKYTRSKFNALYTQDQGPLKTNSLKTSEMVSNRTGRKPKMNNLQEPSSSVAKLKLKKCGALNVISECSENDKSEGKKSVANSDILQLEKQFLESDDYRASRRTPLAPSYRVIPFFGRKTSYTSENSPCESETERNKVDVYMCRRQRKRPKKWTEKENASAERRAVLQNSDSVNSKREGKNDMLIATQLMNDKDSDFGIDSEDMKDYYFTDEDSDTVYKNY